MASFWVGSICRFLANLGREIQKITVDIINLYIILTNLREHKFIGKQIQINTSVDHLIPAVSICYYDDLTFEANFGNTKDKPFQYDIRNCPGMELDCI
jgi:hypothetical protein